MRTAALLTLLLLPLWPQGAAQQTDDAWHDEHPFHLSLTLGAATDPLEGRSVTIAREQLVLVPIDVTGALRDAGTWPFDAAGRPLAWTFAPETLRAYAAGSTTPLPARFLPYTVPAASSGEYDPSSNAIGTLALILPPGVRAIDVFFDIAEARPAPLVPPEAARARLDELAGLGPFAATMAHVPRPPPGATPALVVLAPDATTRVLVQRLQPGAPASTIAQTDVALVSTIDLPASEEGYDVAISADRPILALLRTSATAGGAFFHAALEGAAAGTEFLLATPGRAHVVGTKSGTSVSILDARTGASVGSMTLGRLSAQPIDVPTGGLLRVRASGPVLVLQQGATAEGVDAFLHAGRAIAGAGSGTLVLAARAAGHAASASEPTTAQAFPLSAPQSAASASLGEPTRPAWIARASAPPQTEAWAFSADAPLTVLTGSDGYAPLAGFEGRAFDVMVSATRDATRPADAPLAARLLAPFPETRVEIERRSFDGSRSTRGAIDLGARGSLSTVPGTDDDLAAEGWMLHVAATKPVFLSLFRPGVAAVAPLPGLPPIVAVTSARLEHAGAILAWTPLTTIHTARAGETARVELTLANLGRTKAGEGVVENVVLEAAPLVSARCKAGWEVALADARVDGLGSPGQRSVETLFVVPDTAQAGECLEVELRARSSFDPDVVATARISVRARSAFQPELRVLGPDGAATTSISIPLEAGIETHAELRLRNLGGESGTAVVRHAKAPGYESRIALTPGGEPTERVDVGGGAEARLWLTLRAPTGAEPPWDFVIQATSVADPASRDEAIVSATPRAELKIAADASERRTLVAPGASVSIPISVANLGADAEIRARVASQLPAGWSADVSPERTLLRAPGTRGDLGERLDASIVQLRVQAAADSRVGETIPIAVSLEGGGSSLRVPILVGVANELQLDVTAPERVRAGPRDSGIVSIEARSRAPGTMNVALRSLTSPPGWTVRAEPAAFELAPGETRRIDIRYEVAPLAAPGPSALGVTLQLSDAHTPSRIVATNVSALTEERAALRVVASTPRVVLASGDRAPVLFEIANDGNMVARLEPRTSGPIALAGPLPEALAPGGRLVVAGTIGPEVGDAGLALGDARATVRVVAATRDVRIVSALVREADGSRFLELEIENAGTLASGALILTLDPATHELPALPPGERARHTVLAPATLTSLSVASADGLADAAVADNVWHFAAPPAAAEDGTALAAARRAVPGPAIALAIAIALALRRRA